MLQGIRGPVYTAWAVFFLDEGEGLRGSLCFPPFPFPLAEEGRSLGERLLLRLEDREEAGLPPWAVL